MINRNTLCTFEEYKKHLEYFTQMRTKKFNFCFYNLIKIVKMCYNKTWS